MDIRPIRRSTAPEHHSIVSVAQSRLTAVGLGLALLTAGLLPLNLLAIQPFHHDEALYAAWALPVASGDNPWLVKTPIDKPPLFLYLVAGSMRLFGPTETAARLPSLIATLFSVGLTFRLGQTLYGTGVGLLAAWLVALSPFTIMFAPTALTDPLLVALVLAGCLAAGQGRAIQAGVWLGLAIATKQPGLLFLPLAGGLLAISRRPPQAAKPGQTDDKEPSSSTHKPGSPVHRLQKIFRPLPDALGITRYLAPFTPSLILLLTTLLTFLPVLFWDWSRAQTPGFWRLGLINYGGLSTATGSLNERWGGFLALLSYASASPLLNTIFLAGLPLLLIDDARRLIDFKKSASPSPANVTRKVDRSSTADCQLPVTDYLLTLFALAFFVGHVLLSFQVWDRYLLGLIPLLALLFARLLGQPWVLIKHRWLDRRPEAARPAGLAMSLGLILLLILTLAGPVHNAVNARYPLGSHSAALHGIDQITAYLQGNVGANQTLYHRWLGPHWRFYLEGYPYDLRYWSSPEALAEQAQAGHLIAFPSWRSETEARLALAEAGLTLRELTRAYTRAGYPSLVLYRIEARPAGSSRQRPVSCKQ